MDLSELAGRQGEFPVDEVLGQVLEVDRIRNAPSQYGEDQRVQDIVLQDSKRRRFAIAVYDLNLGCFRGQCGRGKKDVDFEPTQKSLWLRFTNTAKEGKTASLRKLKTNSGPAKHYAGRGVNVVLKSTGTVWAHWVLDEGQDPPAMRLTGNIKKTRDLRVPGEDSRPKTPPAETRRQAPPPEEKPVAYEPTFVVERTAKVATMIIQSLQAAYGKAEVTIPKADQLIGIANSIFIALKDKKNPLDEDLDHLKHCCWALAAFYVMQHKAVVEVVPDGMIPEEKTMPLVTTCFIQATKGFILPKKEGSRSGDRGRDSDRGRGRGRDSDRDRGRGRDRDRR